MNSYLLFKSLHLIAVISWMAGLLYLPRIFVYHVENIDHKTSSSIFKTMERKLFYFIMMPAMILTWIFGLIVNLCYWLLKSIFLTALVKTKINFNYFINNLSFLFRKIT